MGGPSLRIAQSLQHLDKGDRACERAILLEQALAAHRIDRQTLGQLIHDLFVGGPLRGLLDAKSAGQRK